MIFFTSDHHFGHENIIKYCGRPWRGRGQMNDAMINRWNQIVTDEDIVYHIGDFSFGSVEYQAEILNRLNYKEIYLIKGNHDKSLNRMLNVGFDHAIDTILLSDLNIRLIHDPGDVANSDWPRDILYITGHRHNNTPQYYTWMGYHIINVGVDLWDFYPVSLEKINELRINLSIPIVSPEAK